MPNQKINLHFLTSGGEKFSHQTQAPLFSVCMYIYTHAYAYISVFTILGVGVDVCMPLSKWNQRTASSPVLTFHLVWTGPHQWCTLWTSWLSSLRSAISALHLSVQCQDHRLALLVQLSVGSGELTPHTRMASALPKPSAQPLEQNAFSLFCIFRIF